MELAHPFFRPLTETATFPGILPDGTYQPIVTVKHIFRRDYSSVG